MRTLDDLDVEGKRVLVRVDFNVPLDEDRNITDDARIRAALPTLRSCARRARAARPARAPRAAEGRATRSSRCRPAADRLGELLGVDVALAPDLDDVPDGEVVMVENVRFFEGETKNDAELAAALRGAGRRLRQRRVRRRPPRARLHRGASRTCCRSAAGRLLEREVDDAHRHPRGPEAAARGGRRRREGDGQDRRARGVPRAADTVLIGGAMCFPFFKAAGPRRRLLAVRGGGRRARVAR